MAQSQFPLPVLYDARGNPFSSVVPPGGAQPEAAPPGATLPDGYQPTLILVEPGGGNIRLTERDAEFRSMAYADIQATQAPIAAVVGKMVRRLSVLKRKVYKKPARGKSQNGTPSLPEVDEDNTLHDLLCRPAPGFGRMSLTEWQALSLLVNGNSLLVKFRGDGKDEPPTELFPLDWRFSQAWARIGTPVMMWATVQTGQWVSIMPSEVVHTAWASVAGPNGAWLGTSPLGQLGVTIKIDEAAAAFAASHFQNASRPGGIISISPQVVEARQLDNITTRIEKQVEQAYRGENRAFRTPVLAGGATWTPWGNGSADEAQLVQTREQDFVEVCGVYDMPFSAMFSTQGRSAEDDAQVWKALMPFAEMLDDRLQAQLVDPEPEWDGFFVRSDFDEVLYGDPLVLSDKMVAEVGAGIRSRDEARIRLGLNPRGGAANELIYAGAAEGIVGDLPGSFSAAVEEREMVMPPPGEEQPLEEVPTKLGGSE